MPLQKSGEYAYKAVEEVLWLDVSVDDVLRVQIDQCITNLLDIVSCLLLRETLIRLLLKLLVKLATRRVLQYKINLLLVPEEPIHAEHVLMSQVRLDLDFSTQLMLDVALEQLLLVENF